MAKAPKVGIIKAGRSRVALVSAKAARALVRTGLYGYAEEPAPHAAAPATPPPPPSPEDGLDSLSYWDLRRMVAERGLEAEGNKKEDLLRALRAPAA